MLRGLLRKPGNVWGQKNGETSTTNTHIAPASTAEISFVHHFNFSHRLWQGAGGAGPRRGRGRRPDLAKLAKTIPTYQYTNRNHKKGKDFLSFISYRYEGMKVCPGPFAYLGATRFDVSWVIPCIRCEGMPQTISAPGAQPV